MYSSTVSGLPSKSEESTATSSCRITSKTSGRYPTRSHRLLEAELVDQRLQADAAPRAPRSPLRRRSAPSRPHGTRAQEPRCADQHVVGLLRPQGRHHADQRRSRRRCRARPAGPRRPPSAGQRDPVGDVARLRRRDPLDLGHPPLIGAARRRSTASALRPIRWRSIIRRCGCPSQDQVCSWATKIGTGTAGLQQRAPEIRADLVGVQDVDLALAHLAHEPSPGTEVEPGPAAHSDEARARLVELREDRLEPRAGFPPRRHQRWTRSARGRGAARSGARDPRHHRRIPSDMVITRSLRLAALVLISLYFRAACGLPSNGPSLVIRPSNKQRSRPGAEASGPPGVADRFSTAGSFAPHVGDNWERNDGPQGYYIDFAHKAPDPTWPPAWLDAPDDLLDVATIQWALGAWERYARGEGEQWLEAAARAGSYLLERQCKEGVHDGAWLYWLPMPHTYRIDPPWVSAIAQGEAASLLVRLHAETGDDRFAEGAARALRPMQVPTARGGLLAELEGGLTFFEEYPTRPASFVLNGGIFALWGFRDVATGLGDDVAASGGGEASRACWRCSTATTPATGPATTSTRIRSRTSPAAPTTCSTRTSSGCSPARPARRPSRAPATALRPTAPRAAGGAVPSSRKPPSGCWSRATRCLRIGHRSPAEPAAGATRTSWCSATTGSRRSGAAS